MAGTTEKTGQLQKAFIQLRRTTARSSSADVLAGAANALNGTDSSAQAPQPTGFILPFNPSELTFEARGGGKVQVKNLQKKEDNRVVETYTYEPVTPTVTMKIKLTFDNSEKKEGSVQKEVEGFLAAIRSPDTQSLEFHWNKFQFCGTLTQVSAQYTMFSSYGRPVRAVVDMEINGKKEQVETYMGTYRKLLGY